MLLDDSDFIGRPILIDETIMSIDNTYDCIIDIFVKTNFEDPMRGGRPFSTAKVGQTQILANIQKL